MFFLPSSDSAVSAGGARHADPASQHVIDAGRDSESGGAKTGGEGEASPEQSGSPRQGAGHAAASDGDAQAKGHRVGPVCRRSEASPGEVPRTDQGDAADGGGEDFGARSRGLQDKTASRRACLGQEEGRAAKEDRDGFGHGRDLEGRDPGVQGDSDVSVVQGQAKGRSVNQVFPLLLLRLSPYKVRDETAEVSQV